MFFDLAMTSELIACHGEKSLSPASGTGYPASRTSGASGEPVLGSGPRRAGGQAVTDCGPDEFAAECFGAAGYPDVSELPEGAVRASLGCGNPAALAELSAGEIVLDLGVAAVSTCCSPRSGSGRRRVATAWTPAEMIALARKNAAAQAPGTSSS